MFFRQLSDAVAAENDSELLLAIWELVWAGQVTNDTLAPLRALVTGGSRPAARRRAPTRRYGRRAPARPTRAAPAAAAGRWSLTPAAAGAVGSVGSVGSLGPASVGPAPAREPEDAASGRPTPGTPEPHPAAPGPPIREGSPGPRVSTAPPPGPRRWTRPGGCTRWPSSCWTGTGS
jgi:hypothetical protein